MLLKNTLGEFMKEIKYKKYNEEEKKIYNESIQKILTSLRNGNTFQDACKNVEITDPSLKKFIHYDAIKVMIAELHYRDGLSLDEVAKRLDIPVTILSFARMEMLEEVALSISRSFRENNPDFLKSFDA